MIWLCGGFAAAQTPPGYSITEIGLTGPNYTYTLTDGYTNQYGEAYGLNAAGQADGYSSRYDSAGNSLGQDVWIESNGITKAVGLTGNNYNYSTNGGTYQYSSLSRFGITIDPAGQFFGETNRYDTSGNTLGFDAWFYNGSGVQQVGLIGPGYSYAAANGVYEYSEEAAMNNFGQAIGDSERYNSSGNSLGDDSWFFSGTTTIPIGLTGANYSYNYTGAGGGVVQINRPGIINDAGQAIGTSNRFSSTGSNLGEDSWFFNGATTQEVGLVGANYSYTLAGSGTYEQVLANRLNNAGDVSGISTRYNSSGTTNLGQDAWIFNGTTTQQIGLIGSQYQYTLSSSSGGGTYEQSGVFALNNSGHAIGESFRYNSAGTSIGTDAWFFDGSTTRQIGLTGPGYSYTTTQPGGGTYESNDPGNELNNAGKVAGGSDRYASNGAPLGNDAWFFNGSTTQAIGLSGPGFSYPLNGGMFQSSYPSMINNNPDTQVLGISHRYDSSGNSLGQAAWVFDSATDTTTPLLFSTRADGYAYTEPMVFTDTGVVLGYYDVFSGPNSGSIDAFYWSPQYGLYDLGALVNGSISAAGLSQITGADLAAGEFLNGSPQFILGYGEMPQSEGLDIFLMNAVPEPTTFAYAAIAVASVFQRRR